MDSFVKVVDSVVVDNNIPRYLSAVILSSSEQSPSLLASVLIMTIINDIRRV